MAPIPWLWKLVQRLNYLGSHKPPLYIPDLLSSLPFPALPLASTEPATGGCGCQGAKPSEVLLPGQPLRPGSWRWAGAEGQALPAHGPQLWWEQQALVPAHLASEFCRPVSHTALMSQVFPSFLPRAAGERVGGLLGNRTSLPLLSHCPPVPWSYTFSIQKSVAQPESPYRSGYLGAGHTDTREQASG